jgi:signal transduction histidine kinase
VTASTLGPAVNAAAAVALVVAGGLAASRGDRRGARPMAACCWLLAAIAAALAGARVGVLGRLFAERVLVAGWLSAVVAWTVFAFAYTGRGPLVTRRRAVALGALPVAFSAVTFLLRTAFGPAAAVTNVVASLVVHAVLAGGAVGIFLVVRSALADGDARRWHAVVFVGVGGVVVVSLLVGLVVGPLAEGARMQIATAMTAATGAATLGAFAFGDPLADAPAAARVARETVLDELTAAVVVSDRDGRVVDANDAARETVGVDVERGRPVAAVLGKPDDDVDDDGDGRVELETPVGRREFDVTRSALTDSSGGRVGAAYVLRDVTERRTRRQRLEVFNRVLRHNLRNDLDAIRGFAEPLRDGDADDPVALAGRAADTARSLTGVAATVERADRVLSRDALARERTDVVALAESVAESVRADHPTAEVAVDAPEELVVRTDPAVLRAVVREIVDNAAEHGGGGGRDGGNGKDGDDEDGERTSGASVAVRVRASGADTTDCDGGVTSGEDRGSASSDGATLVVADDGPGIPDQERAVLLEGEETPLRHGTGVGLWLANWGVTRLGGELSVRDRSPRGTEVAVSIPDQTGGSTDANGTD